MLQYGGFPCNRRYRRISSDLNVFIINASCNATKPSFFLKNEVDTIIANKETDRKKIEWTFDYLLDYTRHGIGSELYLRLIAYYRTVNPEGAASYLQIYQEQEDEE